MNFHFAIYFFVKSEKVIPLKGMSEFDGRPVQNQKKIYTFDEQCLFAVTLL